MTAGVEDAAMGLLVPLLLASCCAAAPVMPLEFDEDPGWEPRPSFQGNPAERPEIVARDGHVTFRVTEPGRGMKFELALRPFEAASATYLLLRYRAQNLAGGYAIWVYDSTPGGKQILGVGDYVQDGGWHIAAVDLWAAGAVGAVRSLVTEVQCREEPAEVSFDYVRLSDELPEGATVVPATRPEPKELMLRPAELESFNPEPDWLANESDAFGVDKADGVLHLYADHPGKGMKWSVPLAEPIDLSEYRFAAIRYRARDFGPSGDYFVWLGSEGGGMPQESRAVLGLREVQDDDRWHVAVVPLSEGFSAVEMALQVQSGGARGEAWIDYIQFTSRKPLVDLSDLIPFERGWGGTRIREGQLEAVSLSAAADTRAQTRLRALGLKSWFPEGPVTVHGIPFRLEDGEENAVSVPLDVERTADVSVDASAGEVYLLLAAALPIVQRRHNLGPVQMQSFSNPERFVCKVEYQDGLTDEVFPVCVGTEEYEVTHGLGVYCLTGLREAAIRQVRLQSKMTTAAYLLAGVTLNQGPPVTAMPHVTGLPAASPVRDEEAGQGQITPDRGGYVIENDLVRLDLQTEGGIILRGIENRCLREAALQLEPGPLFEIGDGEALLTSDQLSVGEPKLTTTGRKVTLTVPVDGTPSGVSIKGDFSVTVGEGPEVLMGLDLVNSGEEVLSPVVNFPVINGMRTGSVEDTWYLYGRKGGIINNLPIHERKAYGGEHPLQVMDVFSPGAGGGLALLTYDLDDIYRFWGLSKDDSGVSWRMEYFPREHQPGERIETAPTALRAHTGDWRRALRIYRDWAQSWYEPQVPRKDWFQRVFYYQQTTAWGVLRDRESGEWRMAETVKRYRDYFGRLDYLHIFDFGQSKVYGRVGDYSHYEELGGLEVMRGAIKQAQDMGVRIGLYIEGYLCDERGVWGREHVSKCDIRKQDGSPLLWQGAPMEHMMCSACQLWRDHLADTYRRVAGELKPDGMYIDQYGFGNTWKICHSREHGHPVPWGPIRGERDTTAAIREAIPQGIANLTEETPNEVNSQHQDGALGYSVWSSEPALMPHRVDLFRFVFPDFKVFQLTQYEAFTEGGWERLKFPFFNGEGYWLGGGTDETYCEEAHQFLRKAFAILHENEAAFCSEDVEPLVPTLCPTVYANRFTGEDRTAWTLFNAEYRTFRGDCLAIAHREGTRYVDAFTGDEAAARIEGGQATIAMELGPRGVGCVVARRQ